MALLNRALPEINLQHVALGDVVDFLRDLTGHGFFVDWAALEAAGVDPKVRITIRVEPTTFSDAMDQILAAIPCDQGKLLWRIGDGKIVITAEQAP